MYGNPLSLSIAALLLFYAAAYLIAYIGGRLVDRGVKVNYTRKMHHFVVVCFPWFLQQAFRLEKNLALVIVASVLMPLHLAAFCRPVRERFALAATMFRGLDRPEDRPHTLFWLVSQHAAVFLVLPALYTVMLSRGVESWIGVVVAIHAFGDGLAEPVGVTFGRHSYVTYALFSPKKYRRTWEGSACVAVTAVIVILLFRNGFTDVQLAIALAILPISAALTEALSPHTWDAPFMFLVVGGELILLTWL